MSKVQNTYYKQGMYQRDTSSDNTWLSGGQFYSRWDDFSANEDKTRIELEYWNGSAWVYYNYFEWNQFIGAHQNTGQGHDLQIYADLNSYGAPHGKYHRMCTVPIFGCINGTGVWCTGGTIQYGTKTCSSQEWWP